MGSTLNTFRAGRRLRDFRAFVRELYDRPLAEGAERPPRMAGDWIAAQRNPPAGLAAPAPPITLEEWLQWERQPGFTAWWEQLFPEWSTPTDHDFALLAATYYRGLARHMDRGERWAFQQMGRIEHDHRRIKEEQGNMHEDLADWLKKDTSGWSEQKDHPTLSGRAPANRPE